MRTLLMLLALLGATPVAAEVRTATPGATPPPAKVEDLAWLVGHWEGEGLGGRSMETFSPPAAGQMAGHFQQVGADGRLKFYELYQFVPQGNSLVLRLKHFNADLTGWEEKDETVSFPLVAIETSAAYFNGLTFRRTADGGLESFVRVRGEDGKAGEMTFRYRRKVLD